jgi:hypothetical protein
MIPNSNAAAIMKLGFKEQRKMLSIVCPNMHEKIWDIIGEDYSIKAEIVAIGAGAFSDISCKRWSE